MIYLMITVGALLVFLGWLEWLHVRERRTLINTIIARTAGEVKMLNEATVKERPLIDRHRQSWNGSDEPVLAGDLDGFDGQIGLS